MLLPLQGVAEGRPGRPGGLGRGRQVGGGPLALGEPIELMDLPLEPPVNRSAAPPART